MIVLSVQEQFKADLKSHLLLIILLTIQQDAQHSGGHIASIYLHIYAIATDKMRLRGLNEPNVSLKCQLCLFLSFTAVISPQIQARSLKSPSLNM